MRRLGVCAALVTLLACETRGDLIGVGASPIQLPVEVLGANGTVREVQLALGPEAIARAARFALDLHGLAYPEQASVSLNEGAFVPIDEEHVVVDERARAHGALRGGVTLVRVRLPVRAADLRLGLNTLRFRFNRTNGVSIGYRVIGLDLESATGERLLRPGLFREDDPATWRAPRPGSADVEAGRRLWREAPLSRPGGADAAGADGRTPISARCADCHTADGRDLQYFSYSNVSIVERAKFYGLGEREGEQLASYIRSLAVPRLGRPWNPPYQPGPGLDNRPLDAWAAGAGAGAVLARDADAVAALFPGDAITAAAVATSATLNTRETPLPLPLPDWNHWLPAIHPKDAFGAAFSDHPVATRYGGLRAKLAHATASYLGAPLDGDLRAWGEAFIAEFRSVHSGSPASWTRQKLANLEAVGRWQAVKAWELMQEFALERQPAALYGARGEKRSWFASYGFLTHAMPWPPEKSLDETLYPAGSRLGHLYWANAWMAAAAVVHPGSRSRQASDPLDWALALVTSNLLSEASGQPGIGRTLALVVKGMQEADNGIGPETPTRGWTLRYANPVPLFAAPEGAWRDVTTRQRAAILEAVLASWLARARSFPPARYARSPEAAMASASFDVPPEDHVARPNLRGPYPDQLRALVPMLPGLGVSGALAGDLCDFAKSMWPRGDWDAVRPR